ncbi:phosphoribulokinase [Filobacillus milosensis]|uniref:Phosphoribulokinase n=1 Tax=Filobacillus milosensis TaxID=94137 RepID=A0A4Y8IJT3_9BACI|nr:phosphoribulokinase [Filobacillus milosensis]TFB19554.1 phosphoribulokinase [Filobacillus milosensis]
MDAIIQKVADRVRHSSKRTVIGISGHGASGKTTFAKKLSEYLNPIEVNYINTDPYIIGSSLRKYTLLDYEYENKNHRFKMTACHPVAHNAQSLERDVKMVRDGLDLYTMDTHYLKSTLITPQNKITIVEGMSVAFINPELLDLKIYLYTDGETELNRRGIRDVSERGADMDFIRQSHEERRIQYELFMHPYHKNFDVVLKNSNEGYDVEKLEMSDY